MSKIRLFNFYCTVFLLCFSFASCEEEAITEVEGITILTDHGFEKFMETHDKVLVKFMAPWCGHCKSMIPHYIEAAAELKQKGVPAVLAELDATLHKKSAQKYEVSGYPTLLWFVNGEAKPYDGGREKTSFVQWVSEKSDPNYIPPPDVAVDLTDNTFDDAVNQDELCLVMFYAPWCGHCKKMKPYYETSAKDLQGEVPLYKVDATVEKELATRFEISGYPTLFMFRKGVKYAYNGPTENAAITEYMRRQMGEASTYLTSTKLYKKFHSKDKITVIGYLDNDQAKTDMFHRIANKMRDDYLFGHFDSETIAKENYIFTKPSLTVISPTLFPTEDGNSISTIGFDKDEKSMENFIQQCNVPLVGEYREDNKKYYDVKLPIVFFFYTVDYSSEGKKASEFWRHRILKIAKDYKDKITFAIADDEKFPDLVKKYNHDNSGEEMNVGMCDSSGLHYHMPEFEEWDEQLVRDFIENVQNGRLRPYLKSQRIPKKPAAPGKPTMLVAKNFEMTMNDNNLDKFIVFHAPWCGHCKKLLPVVDQLAKDFKNVKQIMIAKFDSANNEIPIKRFKELFDGYPTIYFVKANEPNDPIKYEEKVRELNNLTAFIKKHATVSLDNHDEL